MRFFLALGGALALTGCVSGERVTLLDPIQDAKKANNEVGSIVVDPDGEAQELTAANQQALLREGRARVRTVSPDNPDYQMLLANLPLEVDRRTIMFEVSGQTGLSESGREELKGFLLKYLVDFQEYYADIPEAERPELHVEIQAFSDSSGFANLSDSESTRRNQELSDQRANDVRAQILQLIEQESIPIDQRFVEANGYGEGAARRASGGNRVSNPEFRVVVVTVR